MSCRLGCGFHTHPGTGDIVIGYECQSLEELEILEEEMAKEAAKG
jgi:hypothetical protein